MTKNTRRTFSSEFRLESALLVVDQGYTVREACEAMNVSKSAASSAVSLLYVEGQFGSPIFRQSFIFYALISKQ